MALFSAAFAILAIGASTNVEKSQSKDLHFNPEGINNGGLSGESEAQRTPNVGSARAGSPGDGRFQVAAFDQAVEETQSDALAANLYVPDEEKIYEFRDEFGPNGFSPVMVIVPDGDFMLGSPSEETGHVKNEAPQTPVQISSFAISKYEVTVAEFENFLVSTQTERSGACDVYEDGAWVRKDNSTSLYLSRDASLPAICITWTEATAYTEWMSEQTGLLYRLPTEAEWEYAAKAGSKTAFSFGDDPDTGCGHMNGADRAAEQTYKQLIGVGCNDGFSELAPVGSLLPNAFGLHDMHGNVWEWTSDAWTDSHAPGEIPDENRVIKGGSWFSYPMWLRSSNRNAWQPDLGRADVGFRVVRSIPEEN